MIILSENFRALFYTPFYAAQATGAYAKEGVEVEFRVDPRLRYFIETRPAYVDHFRGRAYVRIGGRSPAAADAPQSSL